MLVLSTGFALFRLSAAVANESAVWQMTDRPAVQGQLAAVYGSYALLIDKSQDFFIPLERVDDAGLKRVVDFLAAKPAVKPTWGTSTSQITKALRNHLEILSNDRLISYDPGEKPEPDIYLIYFSAHWCPPCQRFTPELVKAYHRLQELIPKRFEVVYISNDNTENEQEKYAREAMMPWPVLKYSEVGHATVIQRWAGDGIPCLVALTPEGKLIFHSYNGEEYLGPDSVLTSFEALVPMLQGSSPEIKRARHRLSIVQQLAAVGQGNSAPLPYFIPLHPSRYKSIEYDQIMVTLKINEKGRVTDAQFEPALSAAVEDIFSHDATDNWLFLPAIEQGKLIAQTVKLPLQLKPKS